jgi:hypothetical protein
LARVFPSPAARVRLVLSRTRQGLPLLRASFFSGRAGSIDRSHLQGHNHRSGGDRHGEGADRQARYDCYLALVAI